MNALFALEPIKKKSPAKIGLLRNTITKHIGALKSLGRNTTEYSDILINRVISLLDPRTKRDWELSLVSNQEFPTYDDLDKFLLILNFFWNLSDVQTMNQCFESHTVSKSTHKQQPNFHSIKTHLVATTPKYILCNESHPIHKCKQFRDSSVDERFDTTKKYRLCINCLNAGHKLNDSKVPINCFKCQKRHHTLLHRETQATTAKREDLNSSPSTPSHNNEMQIGQSNTVSTHFSLLHKIDHSNILLSTARVWVLSPTNRAIRVRALLDPGSTWTFISRELVRALGLKLTSISGSLLGVGDSKSVSVSSAADIRISADSQDEPAFYTQALILPNITSYRTNCKRSINSWPHLTQIQLTDDPSSSDPIQVLIGANLYGDLIRGGIKRGGIGEPIAQNTIFGWVHSGNTESSMAKINACIVNHCISNNALDASLKKFFELEDLTQQKIASIEDKISEEHFHHTCSRTTDGRYIVRIPFKSEVPLQNGESRNRAESCLKGIDTRIAKNIDLRIKYTEFMNEYKSLEHMKFMQHIELPLGINPVFISHNPVIWTDSVTRQLRVVFNASAKTSNNSSLNDHMYTGPALQSDLPTIILNWRSYQFVYIVDIAKMYRQILVNLLDVWC